VSNMGPLLTPGTGNGGRGTGNSAHGTAGRHVHAVPRSPFPVPCFHHHRTFNVARPINTSTTEMIQKRTITLGSGQPFNSKW
jgi:hypothetical protein